MNESRVIPVSFKKTSRDIKLYTYVVALEEKSDFIKDSIEYYIKYLQEKSLADKG